MNTFENKLDEVNKMKINEFNKIKTSFKIPKDNKWINRVTRMMKELIIG